MVVLFWVEQDKSAAAATTKDNSCIIVVLIKECISPWQQHHRATIAGGRSSAPGPNCRSHHGSPCWPASLRCPVCRHNGLPLPGKEDPPLFPSLCDRSGNRFCQREPSLFYNPDF